MVSWHGVTIIRVRNIPPERRGWYTAQEVATATGRNIKTVYTWIRHGLLTAARRPGAKNTHFRITNRAFRIFVEYYGRKKILVRT